MKENIKAPRHWPSWGESIGDRWIPLTKGQQRRNVSIWWCHHECCVVSLAMGKSYNDSNASERILRAMNKINLLLTIRKQNKRKPGHGVYCMYLLSRLLTWTACFITVYPCTLFPSITYTYHDVLQYGIGRNTSVRWHNYNETKHAKSRSHFSWNMQYREELSFCKIKIETNAVIYYFEVVASYQWFR